MIEELLASRKLIFCGFHSDRRPSTSVLLGTFLLNVTFHQDHEITPPIMQLKLLLLTLLVSSTIAVDKSKFRTCQNTGFCKRYRDHKPASHVRSPRCLFLFLLCFHFIFFPILSPSRSPFANLTSLFLFFFLSLFLLSLSLYHTHSLTHSLLPSHTHILPHLTTTQKK